MNFYKVFILSVPKVGWRNIKIFIYIFKNKKINKNDTCIYMCTTILRKREYKDVCIAISLLNYNQSRQLKPKNTENSYSFIQIIIPQNRH